MKAALVWVRGSGNELETVEKPVASSAQGVRYFLTNILGLCNRTLVLMNFNASLFAGRLRLLEKTLRDA